MVATLNNISRVQEATIKFPVRGLIKKEQVGKPHLASSIEHPAQVKKVPGTISSSGNNDGSLDSPVHNKSNNHKPGLIGLASAFIISTLLAIGVHTTSALDGLGETFKNIVKSTLTLAGIFFGVGLGAASIARQDGEIDLEEEDFKIL